MYHSMRFYMVYTHWLSQLPQTALYLDIIITGYYVIHICNLEQFGNKVTYLLTSSEIILCIRYKSILFLPNRKSCWEGTVAPLDLTFTSIQHMSIPPYVKNIDAQRGLQSDTYRKYHMEKRKYSSS